MAKSLFKVGAEIDFLTSDELSDRLDRAEQYFRDILQAQEGETIVRSAGSFKTDATGGTSTLGYGGADVYRVPEGFDAFLLRLSVDYEGSNAASPVSCDIRICADQNTPAALRAIYNVVPAVFDASRSHAPLFRGGQRVVVSITGGPATTTFYPTVQVLLTRRKALSSDPRISADTTQRETAPLDRP